MAAAEGGSHAGSRCALPTLHLPATLRRALADDSAELKVSLFILLMGLKREDSFCCSRRFPCGGDSQPRDQLTAVAGPL